MVREIPWSKTLGTRLGGISLALLLLALIATYFYIGRRYTGGTLFDRLFAIKRPQPY